MTRWLTAVMISTTLMSTPAWARLGVDDKASLWPRASMADKVDFTDRMGKAMRTLSPDLDSRYFMHCLEETANIGDTKDLTLNDMVRTCLSLHARDAKDPE
ncbi:hypothetical protein ACLBXJ_23615 [Methylobacterium mesophilicum]